jgi:phosphocarrier protein HPr
MIKKQITIINKLGLHARAAAKFVAYASRYGSEIKVTSHGQTVNGKSIMGVMLLAASKDSNIELSVHGDDEFEAFEALERLVNERFEESE